MKGPKTGSFQRGSRLLSSEANHGSQDASQPHVGGPLTYCTSRKARFSTSFTLYLRLNLEKGQA